MDKIAEMLTKIRNAQLAEHKDVLIKYSKLKFALAQILEKEGFVKDVIKEKNNQEDEFIKIILKYHIISNTKKNPAINGMRKISKLGQRIYIKSKDIKRVKGDYGVSIVSTSKGMMTGEESRKLGLGGEYICEVW
jgi:small subunit ribosomal protein S8